jgi:hypothetical protein
MPVHDWSRVTAGIFHHFHHSWIEELQRALNAGVLPEGYYALAEQIAGTFGPDILALEVGPGTGEPWSENGRGLIAVAEAPPRVQFTAETDMDRYTRKQSTVVVRHSGGDRVVALIEVVSPGNKASQHALRSFVDKAAYALDRGYHLLILDLHAPGPRDPNGIHGALWSDIENDTYRQPTDKPLTLAAYAAGPESTRAYVQPIAVGDTLPDMPLFLEPGAYVKVPLEQTYQAAFRGVPQRWRRVLEPPAPLA